MSKVEDLIEKELSEASIRLKLNSREYEQIITLTVEQMMDDAIGDDISRREVDRIIKDNSDLVTQVFEQDVFLASQQAGLRIKGF